MRLKHDFSPILKSRVSIFSRAISFGILTVFFRLHSHLISCDFSVLFPSIFFPLPPEIYCSVCHSHFILCFLCELPPSSPFCLTCSRFLRWAPPAPRSITCFFLLVLLVPVTIYLTSASCLIPPPSYYIQRFSPQPVSHPFSLSQIWPQVALWLALDPRPTPNFPLYILNLTQLFPPCNHFFPPSLLT